MLNQVVENHITRNYFQNIDITLNKKGFEDNLVQDLLQKNVHIKTLIGTDPSGFILKVVLINEVKRYAIITCSYQS